MDYFHMKGYKYFWIRGKSNNGLERKDDLFYNTIFGFKYLKLNL